MTESRGIPKDLPTNLPIFPVQGIVLFPRAPLPLNIFEPRYIAMVEEALANRRLLGVIHPSESGSDAQIIATSEASDAPDRKQSSGRVLVTRKNSLCRVGSLGRITEFSEEDDGRFLIVVRGLARFEVESEFAMAASGFRRVKPNWKPFVSDFHADDSCTLDREHMMAEIVPFLGLHGFEVNEEQLAQCSDEDWVNLLAQIMPSSGPEKQALLELHTVEERARTMMTMINMNRAATAELWPTVQ